jgi:hypothetical protein
MLTAKMDWFASKGTGECRISSLLLLALHRKDGTLMAIYLLYSGAIPCPMVAPVIYNMQLTIATIQCSCWKTTTLTSLESPTPRPPTPILFV